jgi:hypothetical protein
MALKASQIMATARFQMIKGIVDLLLESTLERMWLGGLFICSWKVEVGVW